ncbi:AfsR/SARP family transcriptional regulator [Streptomyces sp. NRRL WC-3618]|uniref:AfsR/SARP family transcriptional regulator n=1 Tax=Streptomyces sp. NRRL WC-3618 TaxID=1519490 RepID=UPI00099D4078|nr:BTAD domain-containing putative transcriptional regulator [Streptomyces sp. NRRL WC-3618]
MTHTTESQEPQEPHAGLTTDLPGEQEHQLPEEKVHFAVLGPVRAWQDGVELHLGPPQQQAFVALLLANAGRPVTLTEAVDILWGQDPPPSAVNVIRRYVGALRRVLEPGLPRMAPGKWLLREGGGYRLDVRVSTLDLLRFRDLCTRGRTADRADRPERAVELYGQALALWRGHAALGIAAESRSHPVFSVLDDERLAVVKEAADASLRCGRAEQMLAQLQRTADDHPLDEPLHIRLIRSLSLTGHQAEALETYQRMRVRLAEELGVEPSSGLLAAHREALGARVPATSTTPLVAAAGDGPTGPSTGPGTAAPDAGDLLVPLPRPAQLPAAYEHFTGREAEIDHMLRHLRATSGDLGPGTTMVINAIGGMAGVGKTTLAVQVAHRVSDRFPDGQLYVNLRGFDLHGSAMDPTEAVRGFLEALGMSPRQMPDGLEAQAALYRSLLANRRVLVLLDNARDADHVRPLLPGAAGCLVLITSRNQLTSLVAVSGAHPLTLDLLSPKNARESLVRRLGADRVAVEPDAVDTIISLCGGLPLALAIITARALMNPTFPLSGIAAELVEANGSLDAFDGLDATTNVRTVFGWSYRTLTAEAARLFRLLSLHPGPDIGTHAAAALADRPTGRARSLLAELTRMHLLTEEAPGRYRFHDLVRAYANELVRAEDSDDERRTAIRRMLDHYLVTARSSASLLDPAGVFPSPPLPPEVSGAPAPLDDTEAALIWFSTERLVFLEVARQAVDHGLGSHAWQLARLLDPVHERSGHWHDWADLQRIALSAAQQFADSAGVAHAHSGLGRAYSLLRHYREAEEHLRHALSLFETLGDDLSQAHTRRALGWVMTRTERNREAIRQTRHALDLYRIAGHLSGQADAMNAIAWYEAVLGSYEKAVANAVRSLSLYRRTSERGGAAEANTWDTLAYAHHHLGRFRRARTCYLRAIAMLRRNGDRYNEAGSLDRLGDTCAATGDHAAARAMWAQAGDILTEIDPSWAAEIRAKFQNSPNSFARIRL